MRLKHVSEVAGLSVGLSEPQHAWWVELERRGCVAYYNLQPALSSAVQLLGTLTIHDRDETALSSIHFHNHSELAVRAGELVMRCFPLTKPVIGSYVQHYKGGLYRVDDLARNSEDRDEWRVIYYSMHFDTKWDRPLKLWNEQVLWPCSGYLPRFRTIDPSEVAP